MSNLTKAWLINIAVAVLLNAIGDLMNTNELVIFVISCVVASRLWIVMDRQWGLF